MKRSLNRIITTHGGSLSRPKDLLEMMKVKMSGQPYDREAFAMKVRSTVADTVRKQVEAGVDVPSDGEEGKPGFANYVSDRLSGIELRAGGPARVMGDRADFPEFQMQQNSGTQVSLGPRRMVAVGPIAWNDKTAVQTDITNFKAALQGQKHEEGFLTAVSPGQLAQNVTNEFYKSEAAFLEATANVMRDEFKAIVDAGFVLQVDSPDLAMGRQTQFPDKSVAEFRKIIEARVEAMNHALAGLPSDRVRLHLCWGNYEGPHHRDVDLKDIIDICLKARAGGLYVEGANPRHEHEWKVFKDIKLPAGTVVVAGMIDTKTNYIEHPEVVADRIHNYANVVGRENIIAATDCGFGTQADRDRVVPSISWAKLKALSDGAALASKDLWR